VAESAEAHSPSWTGGEAKRRAIAAAGGGSRFPRAARRYGELSAPVFGRATAADSDRHGADQQTKTADCDEPTTALDVDRAGAGAGLLRELQKQHGLAMLFISHDLAVVGQVASRVAVMRAGRLWRRGLVRGY